VLFVCPITSSGCLQLSQIATANPGATRGLRFNILAALRKSPGRSKSKSRRNNLFGSCKATIFFNVNSSTRSVLHGIPLKISGTIFLIPSK
jgi:hypothetical protein